ncbi:MAG: hypothetical protein ACI9UN_002744 [Granulosicoccus sp.]|jgi:hypothetical protein
MTLQKTVEREAVLPVVIQEMVLSLQIPALTMDLAAAIVLAE